jgi:hypothetical protein
LSQWPEWWEWELLLPPHLRKRMEDRGFNEVELRQMLIEAISYRANVVADRWVIEARHRNRRWEVIVEPDGLGGVLSSSPPIQ